MDRESDGRFEMDGVLARRVMVTRMTRMHRGGIILVGAGN
jgi:hypothetical protein